MSDYYQILGIPKFADDRQVRKAFRIKAKCLHPDINSDARALREFQRVNEAYQVLRNVEKRRIYDHRLRNGFPSEKVNYPRPGKVKYRARGDKYAHYDTKEQASKSFDVIEKYFDISLFVSLLIIGCFAFIYGVYRLWFSPEENINPYNGIIMGVFFVGMIIFFWRTKDKFFDD